MSMAKNFSVKTYVSIDDWRRKNCASAVLPWNPRRRGNFESALEFALESALESVGAYRW